ncbi:hydantoinase/oxoprolinase family protein [Hoeflea sp. WL0058]|uniref:Hydantoinase/oxoprolinase family protein n=1 Tax=Flavimaribacter sediminis TaxID=2865987 RepID=A0AAE2ZMH2_9HYPH|nr:hydantoinase/oxoprolinase family protein [Flavimaribacter sediminis]MBW8637302.1 hydantoinase/oxoprolinase family protein [Flavimaribacter sediminis]
MANRREVGDSTEGLRIGVDVGGTFTDMVVASPNGSIDVFKVPSTPSKPDDAVMAAVEKAAEEFGMRQDAFLRSVSHFIHGTTIATNTALEGKGARVGLIVTDGFRDFLEIRRGIRENPWDHHAPFAPVLVPRYLRLPVKGRLDAQGSELQPLSVEDVAEAVRTFREEDVESFAICLMNAFLDGTHEREIAAELESEFPENYVTLSSKAAPILGEYERGSTAVMNSYVGPRTINYLRALETRLAQAGLASPLLLVQNNGGITSVEEVADRAVNLMLSGPAAAIGSLNHFAESIGKNSLISMEIGGTSCDVMLMNEGHVNYTDRLQIAGYDIVSPSVEVHTIGAGGGTIARVDEAGLLLLGPEGAGARPGPACYGFGGEHPTVTDAHAVLGRFVSGPYADGAITIDASRAHDAIDAHIASRLGVSVEEAAIGILRLMDQQLVLAVQKLSTERGNDPKLFDLVAGGGAGPLHVVNVARNLGCQRVYVPRISGAFCALGMLGSNCRHDNMRFFRGILGEVSPDDLVDGLLDLRMEVIDKLLREGFKEDEAIVQFTMDLRYVGQQWDIPVPVDLPIEHDRVRSTFETMHEKLFGHVQTRGAIEVKALRSSATGLMEKLMQPRGAQTAATPEPGETRRIWVDQKSGWMDVACYSGATLASGHAFEGPALIEEQTTTLLVGDGDHVTVDNAGNYLIMMADNDNA